jgi:hypothetical protein
MKLHFVLRHPVEKLVFLLRCSRQCYKNFLDISDKTLFIVIEKLTPFLAIKNEGESKTYLSNN